MNDLRALVTAAMPRNPLCLHRYVEGSGELDFCNGCFGPTPEHPEGIYHYHTSMEVDPTTNTLVPSFPYVIGAYKGEPDLRNFPRHHWPGALGTNGPGGKGGGKGGKGSEEGGGVYVCSGCVGLEG